MPKLIIDRFELVDIYEQNSEGTALPFVDGKLPIDELFASIPSHCFCHRVVCSLFDQTHQKTKLTRASDAGNARDESKPPQRRQSGRKTQRFGPQENR